MKEKKNLSRVISSLPIFISDFPSRSFEMQIDFFSCYRKARKSFNQIKCENVFKAYTQEEGKNVMRFHWQWLWHALLRILCLFLAIPALNTFFTRCENKEESESQVQRVSLLGTLVDFIWISCTFSFLSLLLQNTIFTSIHSHFNEQQNMATRRWMRRRKNQITRKNVIKILLFSHCDLYSFTFLPIPFTVLLQHLTNI